MTGFRPSRRAVLAGAAALTFCARTAQAAGGTITVSNWGGDWNDRTVKFVELNSPWICRRLAW